MCVLCVCECTAVRSEHTTEHKLSHKECLLLACLSAFDIRNCFPCAVILAYGNLYTKKDTHTHFLPLTLTSFLSIPLYTA